MREEVGLSLRAEFEDAVEAVEAVEVEPSKELAHRYPADVMAEFHATETDLKTMAARYKGLTIAGAIDKSGYQAVHAGRMELAGARILIDKARKAGNDEAQAAIKMRNNVAKYLTGIVAPIEDALHAEEKRVDAELETIKAQKQAEVAAKLQERIEALQAVQHPFTLAEITVMTDTQFGFLLATAQDAWKVKEAARIEAEAALAKVKAEQEAKEAAEREAKAAADKAEREAFAKAKAEQDAQAKALAEERAKLKDEQDAYDARRRAIEQADREEKARQEGAEKAKAEAERIAAEEVARKEHEKADADARAKAMEAARPDADKVRALAKLIRETALPKASTDAGRAVMAEIETSIGKFATFIEGKANALAPIFNPSAP